MKRIFTFIITSVFLVSLTSCFEDNNQKVSLIAPTGTPTLGLSEALDIYESSFDYNIVSGPDALKAAFIDLPFITRLVIANNTSNIGNPNTITGNTITAAVYVLATPKIETTASINPKKFEPVSPINVFAGEKLNGKNPTNAPLIAVTIIVAIIGEPFIRNITNNDIHDINDIPDDIPSNPSIRFIAFVTPTIHTTVRIVEKASLNPILYKNGILRCSIFIPNDTTIIAASTCPINCCHGFKVFISSIIPVTAITPMPNNTPNSFLPYSCSANKSKLPSMLIIIIK